MIRLRRSTATLTSGSTFTGTSEDVKDYAHVYINITSDVDSAACGVSVEFSSDGTNWDFKKQYTFLTAYGGSHVFESEIHARYFRVVYVNGSTGQSTFRLQTLFHVGVKKKDSIEKKGLVNLFERVKTAEPETVLDVHHVRDKNNYQIYETLTGGATSVHQPNSSSVLLSVSTNADSVIRRTRRRAIYQPGKAFLCLMTGVLNNNNNATSVTSRIGLYDDDGGFYFQYRAQTFELVKRSSVTGSLVETIVGQTSFNIDKVDGSQGINVDLSKTIIFYLELQWLGVGTCTMGVVIKSKKYPIHSFYHSNINSITYMETASLPVTYEISSTSGAGSMVQICSSVISEGGFNPIGRQFSADRFRNTRACGNTREPLLSIKLKSDSKSLKCQVNVLNVNCISTSNGNVLIEIYKIFDTAPGSFLTGSNFTSAGTDSCIEYDINANDITITNAFKIGSSYMSNNNDSVQIDVKSSNSYLTSSNGVSDIIAIVGTAVNNNENVVAAITWEEYL